MKIKKYNVDYSGSTSFKNWMTELDMICEEPFKIGLLGALGFISFALGSAFITRIADLKGRKFVIIWSSLVTPIGIVLLILFAHFSLYIVYSIVFIMGLTYNSRGSTAYIFGCEFLHSSKHMLFGQSMFFLVGILMIASSLIFMVSKDQNIYFIFLIVMMLIAIMWIALFAPESPQFLLSKHRYEDLADTLTRVCKFNRCYDEQRIKRVVQKLKESDQISDMQCDQ
jgi:MFS family permease